MSTTLTPARDKAKALLRELFAHGPVPTEAIRQAAQAEGVSMVTLRQVAQTMGLRYRFRGRGGGWWELRPRPEPSRDASHGLLADVLAAFGERERVHTAELLAALTAYEPWRARWSWLPMPEAAARMAGLLEPYGLRSRRVYARGKQAQGYRRADVLAAVQRAEGRAA
jgi:hypothetical protein